MQPLAHTVRLRRRLRSLVLDMSWYTQRDRKITIHRLDTFLHALYAMLELADDDGTTEKLKQMTSEMKQVQDALLHEDTSYALAKEIIQRIGNYLRLSTNTLVNLAYYWTMAESEPEAGRDRRSVAETEAGRDRLKEILNSIEVEDDQELSEEEKATQFSYGVQKLVENIGADLKVVQSMIYSTTPQTDASDAFSLLTQEIAQHINEILTFNTSKTEKIEQARNVMPDRDTTEQLYALAQELVQRIEEIPSASKLEEIKHNRGILPDTDPEETFYLVARRIVESANALLGVLTPELEEVNTAEVIGQDVVYFDRAIKATILVGRVERFKRANREEREGLVGDITILLVDEQKEMTQLFYDLYFLPQRDIQSDGLYIWPSDLPKPTFRERTAINKRIDLQWKIPLGVLTKKEAWEQVANIPKDETVVRTITYAWKDDRINRRIQYIEGNVSGHLESIVVLADGSEKWNVISVDDGQAITNESSQFWIMAGDKISSRRKRMLAEEELYGALMDALALCIMQMETDNIYTKTRLEGKKAQIQIFLSNDMPEEQETIIVDIYIAMLKKYWNKNEQQREEAARKIATKIYQLRSIGELPLG